jgi:hypothetical protein
MTQHDMNVADGGGAAVLADINLALPALASTSKGPSAPSTPYAGQLWLDDDTPSGTVWTLKQYDGADWISIAEIDTSNNRFNVVTCQSADVASAATLNLDTAYGLITDVTGTTGITAVTLSQGRMKFVRFTGVLTLTHGASLVLPGAANITTAAGDYAIFAGYTSSVVRCVGYFRADGTPVALATQAQMEAASSNAVVVTPGRMQYHPGMAKFWTVFNGTGTIAASASHNVTSLTDNGTGDYTVNLTTAFSSANYAVVGMANSDAGIPRMVALDDDNANTASAVHIEVYSDTEAGTKADSATINLVGYGDQ